MLQELLTGLIGIVISAIIVWGISKYVIPRKKTSTWWRCNSDLKCSKRSCQESDQSCLSEYKYETQEQCEKECAVSRWGCKDTGACTEHTCASTDTQCLLDYPHLTSEECNKWFVKFSKHLEDVYSKFTAIWNPSVYPELIPHINKLFTLNGIYFRNITTASDLSLWAKYAASMLLAKYHYVIDADSRNCWAEYGEKLPSCMMVGKSFRSIVKDTYRSNSSVDELLKKSDAVFDKKAFNKLGIVKDRNAVMNWTGQCSKSVTYHL